MAEIQKFDAKEYASRGFFIPPLGNAATNRAWEYVHEILRDKPGMSGNKMGLVWLEAIPQAAYDTSIILKVKDAMDVHGAAWVHRVDGDDAGVKSFIQAGDVVILPSHVFKQGMAVPSSDADEALAKNKGLRIIPACDCHYRIRQADCEAFHGQIMAEKSEAERVRKETQKAQADKSAPEGE